MPHAWRERLGDRAEDVRVAVRHALAEEHARAELLARDVGDLVREAALADAGVAVQQHECARLPAGRHLHHLAQRADLGVAADDRRSAAGSGAGPGGASTRTARYASTGSSRPRTLSGPSASYATQSRVAA